LWQSLLRLEELRDGPEGARRPDLFREQSRGFGHDDPTLIWVNLVNIFNAD
jgi:hypothetical protein